MKREQAESEVVNLTTLVELLASNSGSKILAYAISLILKQSDPRFASLVDFKRAVTMLELLKVAHNMSLLLSDAPHDDLGFLLWLDSSVLTGHAVTSDSQSSPIICGAVHIDWYNGKTEAKTRRTLAYERPFSEQRV
ncbi:hypothetical protein KCU91_g13, partial [Aureobasidium melanogenum]